VGLLFVCEDRADREYLLDPGETLETDLGVLEVPADVRPGVIVETHLGTAFRARELRLPDLFHHFERTGSPDDAPRYWARARAYWYRTR
jgi:tRNA(1-methyladenosine) methyltransferase and related methyltransferases